MKTASLIHNATLKPCFISFSVMSGRGQYASQNKCFVLLQWKVCVNGRMRICALQALTLLQTPSPRPV